jgi:predicted HTH domain antitoxin
MDLEKMKRAEEEAREVRRRTANWEFIKTLPPKLRIAIEYYIESGDIYNAAKLAGMAVDEFNELRIKAGILAVD